MNSANVSCIAIATALIYILQVASARSAAHDLRNATPPGGLSPDMVQLMSAFKSATQAIKIQSDGLYTAYNYAQNWLIDFDAHGFAVRPHSADWNWGLSLEAYGRCGTLQNAKLAARPRINGHKLSHLRGPDLWEWFANHSSGLMHGFTVDKAPPGEGSVELQLAVRGNLEPVVEESRKAISFYNAQGDKQLEYAGLLAWDAEGRVLNAQLEVKKDGYITFVIDDTDAAYPITIDPVAQKAYFKASNTGAGDYFGGSVAVSGDTAVVGAYREDGATNSLADSGAVYVFTRSAGTWTQQAVLRASNAGADDIFGSSLAISGDTIIVGALREDGPTNLASNSGAAYVFVRSGTTWTQQTILRASNAEANDWFGFSVAISGSTAVVGAPFEDGLVNNVSDSGAVYVFVRSGNTWTEQTMLRASNAGPSDNLGWAVSLANDSLLASAVGEDKPVPPVTNSGAAYLFTRAGNVWTESAILRASNADVNDGFGTSVALFGDTALFGAPNEDGPANNVADSGAAYVFNRMGNSWAESTILRASNPSPHARFGASIAFSHNHAVVGAPGDGGPAGFLSDSGAAHAFLRMGNAWFGQGILRSYNFGNEDEFGIAVGVDGTITIIGSTSEDNSATGIQMGSTVPSSEPGTANDSGAAYVFQLPAGPFPTDLILAGSGDNMLGGKISKKLSGKKKWKFEIKAQNDDATSKLFIGKITGSALSKTKGAKVTIRDASGSNVTKSLARGRFAVMLAPGQSIRLQAGMKRTSHTSRSWKEMKIHFIAADGTSDSMSARARWKR